jgi:hypothetical protein
MTTILDNSKGDSLTDNKPFATSTTTPPRDTFHDVSIPSGGGVLVYWPEKNGFLALFPEEYREFYAEADEHSKKIAKLQDANQKVTEAGIALRAAHKSGVAADIRSAETALQRTISDMRLASDDVKKVLAPLARLDAKDGVKLLELVALKKGKAQKKAVPMYVKSTTLKQVLADKRIYLLEGEKEKPPKEKIFKDGKLNTEALKRKIAANVQDKAKFSKKWKIKPEDADEYSYILSDWAKTMNGKWTDFCERNVQDTEKFFNIDPKDPQRNVDLSAEAQLMRFTGGAGLEMNFNPFKGNLNDQRDLSWPKRIIRGAKSGEFGIKANAHASFAAAEGRIRTAWYLPHFAGWHATAQFADQTLELGYWRCELDITLSGAAGASLAIECDIEVSYTGGKQGVRGIPVQDSHKLGAKLRAGASAELDVFADGRVGVDLKGALQWLNPEGASSNGKPLTIKPDEAIAEFKDIAKVDSSAAGLAGAGLKLAFKIKHESGKFVIYAKIGACVKYGAETSMKFEVDTETIGEFFKCVAYQLKRADYHKIADVIDQKAFEAFCQIHYLMIASARSIKDFVTKSQIDIFREYEAASKSIDRSIKDGAGAVEDFVGRIRSELLKQTGSWLSYAPPEVMGKIQFQLATIHGGRSAVQDHAREAIALALGAPQTMNQLATIAERITDRMGDKQDSRIGFAIIESSLAGTSDADQLACAELRLSNASPLLSGPFIWNNEPQFVIAKMGIEHPMYA